MTIHWRAKHVDDRRWDRSGGELAMSVHNRALSWCDKQRTDENMANPKWEAGSIPRSKALTLFPNADPEEIAATIRRLLRWSFWEANGRLRTRDGWEPNYRLVDFNLQTDSDTQVLYNRKRDVARKQTSTTPKYRGKTKSPAATKPKPQTDWVEWRRGSAKYPPDQRKISDAEGDKFTEAQNEWLARSEWADFDPDYSTFDDDADQKEIIDNEWRAAWLKDGLPAFSADQKKRGVDPELIAWYVEMNTPDDDD